MNPLVQTLRLQHDELRATCAELVAHAQADAIPGDAAERSLRVLRALLDEHLRIEDGIFYPDLLTRMQAQHMDVATAERFIGEMRGIAERVAAFFATFSDGAAIAADGSGFRTALAEVTAALGQRMHAEDAFVYSLYDSLA